MKKIGIACGGTGGHVFPGLAVGRVLRERGHHVSLWLGGRDVETLSAAGWDGPVIRFGARGIQRSSWGHCVGVGWSLLKSIWSCRRVMRAHSLDALLVMGSYASIGPGLAAVSLRIPLFLHEGNAVAGRANKFLSRFATAAGLAVPDAARSLSRVQCHVTGFPLWRKPAPRSASPEGTFCCLVMGGSQGARSVNQVVSQGLICCVQAGRQLRILHVAGRAHEAPVRQIYSDAGVDACVYGFHPAMDELYAAAHIAFSRAGAASCTELAVAGVPSWLIPLPTAPADHQLHNARVLERAGGAVVLPQERLTAELVYATIQDIMDHPERRLQMQDALAGVAVADADERVADMMSECLEEGGRTNAHL